ncbi:hypothetical protein NEOLEDRAFT_1057065 [Neolentinus lepideus HHB14362 ss-1]|uniref:Csf1 N-terminal domain-containing protein n=1 Tax=Neolentinus lepideus HHB14362 ss-1 TaxID=1314782 RepID=A0A165UZU3_9AGAM|nr:hypothetical protein NEOLEDRAFT_1057065 [Neolentinus lepideus HHB14362 ss-1]
MLSYLLLIACVVIVVAVILYLFFWNRLIALILSLLLRVAFWNQGRSSIWVEFGAIHLSIIAGRLSFKNLRYHSGNQTIKIVKGQITWRYWIRSPAGEEDLRNSRIGGEDFGQSKSSWPLSCRILVSLQGLEWFIYNRTSAYDNIVEQMRSAGDHPLGTPRFSTDNRPVRSRETFSKSPAPPETTPLYPPSLFPTRSIGPPLFLRRTVTWVKGQLPRLDPTDFLPLGIEVNKAAIICGNASTRNLLVVEFKDAEGTFGIVPSRSKFDIHKQLLNIKFKTVSSHFVENSQYQSSMPDFGENVDETIKNSKYWNWNSRQYLSYHSFSKIWRRLKLSKMAKFGHTSRFSEANWMHGHGATLLGRWRNHKSFDEATPIGIEYLRLEYAAERQIIETPELELLYYVDVVGSVPLQQTHTGMRSEDPFEVGNGDLPPEWGIEIVVHGGFLRYGPWADRQRTELQRVFFPSSYQDLQPTTFLRPGDKRMWTALKVFVELREGTTLHIPFRESSKDWQWDGLTDVPRPKVREAAHIHIKAGDGSAISCMLPMVVRPTGYETQVEVHLDDIAVTSTLNDIRLLQAESCRVRCELPTPLPWNAERQWSFNVSLRQPVFYLIRDHINMFTDLAKDWSSGPPSDYNRFIPMHYTAKVDLHNYEINTYVNDHNIIDKPLLREENALLTFSGTSFRNNVDIDSDKFRPLSSTVPFWIEAPDVKVDLTLPRWHTHAIAATPDTPNVGRIGLFHLDASYQYFTDVRDDNVDQLKLSFTANVVWKAYGWSVRYFMILRDNYFGTFTHFSTVYEYLDKKKKGLPVGDPIEKQYRKGKSNTLQVELQLGVDHGTIVVPAGLPGYESYALAIDNSSQGRGLGSCIVLNIPSLQVQMRTHDFFMEMSMNVNVLMGCVQDKWSDACVSAPTGHHNIRKTFFIDGLDITAHRLFGPQPRTSTYVCIWEIHVGRIKGLVTALETKIIGNAADAFTLNFSDPLNTPAAEYALPLDPDVTFLKVSVDAIAFVWLAGDSALEILVPQGLSLNTNDLAGKLYRKVTTLRLPEAMAKGLRSSGPARRLWLEAVSFTVDLNLDMYSRPDGWQQTAHTQAGFVSTQDVLTGRAKILYAQKGPEALVAHLHNSLGSCKGALYLPYPQIPSASRPRSSRRLGTRMQGSARFSYTQTAAPPLSESESDEFISDAFRPTTPVAFSRFEDDGIASGDESDDADLTENADGSDSDSFELHDGTSPRWDFSIQHSVASRYHAIAITTPSLWDDTPFTLMHDRWNSTSSEGHCAASSHTRAESTTSPSLLPEKSPHGCDVIILRVSSRRGLDIRVTPLATFVAAELYEDVVGNRFAPELYLDTAIVKYVRHISNTQPKGQHTAVDAYVPLVRVRCMQAISSKSGVPTASSTTSLDLQIQGSNVVGYVTERCHEVPVKQDLNFTFSGASLTFGVAEKRPTRMLGVMANTFIPLSEILLSSTTLEFVTGKIHASVGPLSITVLHPTSHYISATALALAPCSKSLRETLGRLESRSQLDLNRLLRKILCVSQQKAAVDPLSTIQPSFLVQTGLPQQVRTSAAFKVLTHLRRSLRGLDASERGHFMHQDADKDNDAEILSVLEAQASALGADPDSHGRSELLVLKAVLSGQDRQSSASDSPSQPSLSIELRLVEVQTSLWDESRSSPNVFVLRGLAVAATFRPSLMSSGQASRSTKSLVSVHAENSRHDIKHLGITLTIGNVEAFLLPHLLDLAQQMIKAWRNYSSSHCRSPPKHDHQNLAINASSSASSTFYVDLSIFVDRCCAQAAAESLTFEAGGSGIIATSNIIFPQVQNDTACVPSLNQSIAFKEIFFRARDTAEMQKFTLSDRLASLTCRGGRLNVVLRQDHAGGPGLRTVLGMYALQLSVPRSALRLYRFVEDWKADYLPGIEATIQSFLSELQSSPGPSAASSYTGSIPTLQVHVSVGSLGVELQIMPGTWLLWEMADIIAFAKSLSALRKACCAFGLRIQSQALVISSRPSGNDSTRVKLQLPVITIAGDYDGSAVQLVASMALFQATLRPSHWDALMFVQQKSGQDFDDLLLLIQETRTKTSVPSASTNKAEPQSPSRLKFDAHLRMQGFRFGLQGVASTLYLECEDTYGDFSNQTSSTWSLALTDLALSLARGAGTSNRHPVSYRTSRSAFVSIDFRMASYATIEGRSVDITVSKIHAVMQPSSIGEVGDFVDHLQAELVSRREERALEMSKFREKTKSLMRSFEVRVRDTAASDSSSWVDDNNIDLNVKNIGVAFPLTLDQDLPSPQLNKKEAKAVRAFLFSVKSLSFGTRRGGNGSATMQGFSFQFVDSFRQTRSIDFSGESHETKNRIVYPEVTAKVRSERRSTSRQMHVSATVSGFVLDLDSGIPDHIFSLIDVYRRGKERVDRFTSGASRPSTNIEATPRLSPRPGQAHYGALPTSNILGYLVFLSGQVRIHGSASTRATRTRSVFPAIRHIRDESILVEAETLDLPGLSVWAEYRATPASRKLSSSRPIEASSLIFKSTIHSSQNTLRPTLLPFVTEVIKHVEERIQRASTPYADAPRPSKLEVPSTQTWESRVEELEATSSLNVSLSLRIDQSRLELTCQPDVNVLAGVHWDSGGFIATISPGARRVTFTGSVGGLTVGLKHGFLSDDCVRLDARNLSFSVTFGKNNTEEGTSISSMSLVLDTEFSGAVRFSRLQDVLCFKAVWLDRIPVFGGPSVVMPNTPAKGPISLPNSGPTKQEFATAILVRIRRTSVEMDLGQSISTVILDLSDVVFRTRLTGAQAELSLSIMKVGMQFTGNLQGKATMPDFLFQTMRKKEDGVTRPAESTRLLELSMTTGPFDVTLDSERQRLLYYHAEPLDIMIFDDWSNASSQLLAQHHQLRLSFIVTGPEVVATVTVGTIPRLLSYASKFKANIDAQREGASLESQAFRVTSAPKPDNALSAVASAMIQSARTRLTEHESTVSYIIKQDMTLRLDHLRLIVFPRTVRDVEMAQFVGRGVQARLDRHVESDGLTTQRDLQLEFSGIAVSRLHQLSIPMTIKAVPQDTKGWLDALIKDASEAIIFGLPSMKMSMTSTESVKDRIRQLDYNFFSQFIRHAEMKREDIYITLNMSLYAWLTILRKNFAREMDQVGASGEVPSSTKVQAPSPASLRRKAGEQALSIDTLDAAYDSLTRPTTPPDVGRPPNVRASTFTHSRSISHAGSFPSAQTPSPLLTGNGKEVAVDPNQSETGKAPAITTSLSTTKDKGLVYNFRKRHIERLTMRQLGEATPDVMHPFFMKKSGFNLEDSLPQYVHEYATRPLEEIMRALLQLYSKQLRVESHPSSKV